jgi:hypothetical protein
MGQYFIIANLDKREYIDISPAKLMEHTYLGNSHMLFAEALINSPLAWKGDRVVHVGDYYENDSSSSYFQGFPRELYSYISEYFTPVDYHDSKYRDVAQIAISIAESDEEYLFDENREIITPDKFRYAFNSKRKEFIDLFKTPPSYVGVYQKELFFSKIDAFMMLITLGNEAGGGGTYYGPDGNLIGLWASTSDSITFSSSRDHALMSDNESGEIYTELCPCFTELTHGDDFTETGAMIKCLKQNGDVEKILLTGVYQKNLVNKIFERIKEGKV